MMRLLSSVLATAILMAGGCARKADTTEADLEQQKARTTEVVSDVSQLRDRIVAKEYATDKLESTVQDLEIRLRETERRLARAEAEVNQLREQLKEQARTAARAASTTPSKSSQVIKPKPSSVVQQDAAEEPAATGGPTISVYAAPDQRLADFIATPPAENQDMFPFRVSAVTGTTSVIGTHKSTRLVETTEKYRDHVGNLVPRWREEQIEVQEYEYKASFDVENLTKSDKELYVSAGQLPLRVTVKPGETMKGLTLSGSLGAKLTLESGSLTRSYAIEYSAAP